MEVGDYAFHVGLLFALVNDANGQAVLARTVRNGLECVNWRIGLLPLEVLSGPRLEGHDQEEDEEWAEVDEQIFAAVGLEDEKVLGKEGSTFQRRFLTV